jgi:hypothetical protein
MSPERPLTTQITMLQPGRNHVHGAGGYQLLIDAVTM